MPKEQRKNSIHCRNMNPDLVESLERGKITSRSKNMGEFLQKCYEAWEREQEAIREAHKNSIKIK